eukprot:2632902-Heterocapsa_arctica.AAC.1
MRTKLKNDRSLRWRNWVENVWGHKKKDIYKWIRGKKGNGPLIVSKGGSAQMKDILKLAEEDLRRTVVGGRRRPTHL